MTGKQREAIDLMKSMDSVTVTAGLVAQALGMKPDVLRKHVRDGEYKISAVDVNGSMIRFFRKDFLQKIGEMDPDPDHPTSEQLLEKIWEVLMDIRILLKAIANE